jgi:iron complex transport system substrate-binding protein
MRVFAAIMLLSIGLIACKGTNPESTGNENEQLRIITAGGTITEIVVGLGMEEAIIATDITSTYPSRMKELPSIGYRNQIKAEGILSLGADLILSETGYLTADVISQLKSAGIRIVELDKPKSLDQTRALIRSLAELLEKNDEADSMLNQLTNDEEALKTFIAGTTGQPRVAFILARGPETVFLAGEETFVDEFFALAGVENVGQGFKDFIPLSPEALSKYNPEYLMFFESGLQSLGGIQGLSSINGLNQTEAYANGKVIAMDGHYVSGFGPRAAQAALELAKKVRE